ncbi:hypothetical protein A3Q56_03764 [Intoshia linei]|uniref:Uncharacterized protein n=1 Tax=Intoshia linei TaxID=1819745 RepID=A0A177B2K3_9BILA|nr:hypothetical protein A3Q56_03764 [Intoshia linei]
MCPRSSYNALKIAKMLESSSHIKFNRANMKIKVHIPIDLVNDGKINASKFFKKFCTKVEHIKKHDDYVEAIVIVIPGQINELNENLHIISPEVKTEILEVKNCRDADIIL